ncbi:unnamed protein product [Urochloa humidicola]
MGTGTFSVSPLDGSCVAGQPHQVVLPHRPASLAASCANASASSSSRCSRRGHTPAVASAALAGRSHERAPLQSLLSILNPSLAAIHLRSGSTNQLQSMACSSAAASSIPLLHRSSKPATAYEEEVPEFLYASAISAAIANVAAGRSIAWSEQQPAGVTSSKRALIPLGDSQQEQAISAGAACSRYQNK